LGRQGLQHVARHARQGACSGRGRAGLPRRPCAGPAEGCRGAAAGKEDLRHSRLEEGAATRVLGQGERLAPAWCTPRAPRRNTLKLAATQSLEHGEWDEADEETCEEEEHCKTHSGKEVGKKTGEEDGGESVGEDEDGGESRAAGATLARQ